MACVQFSLAVPGPAGRTEALSHAGTSSLTAAFTNHAMTPTAGDCRTDSRLQEHTTCHLVNLYGKSLPVQTHTEANAREFKHAPAVLGALARTTHLTCSRSSPPASTRFYPRWGRHGSTLFALRLEALDPHVSGHTASLRVIGKVVHLRAFVSCCPENFQQEPSSRQVVTDPLGQTYTWCLGEWCLREPSASFWGSVSHEATPRRSSLKHATFLRPCRIYYAHHILA